MVDIYVNKRDSVLSILLKVNMILFVLKYVMYEYIKMNVSKHVNIITYYWVFVC